MERSQHLKSTVGRSRTKSTYAFGVKRLKVVLNYRIKLTLHEFYPDETEAKQNRLGQLTLGNKQYELSNHLGNVLTVITDRKLGMKDASGNLVLDTEGLIATFVADVLSVNNYYPFGLAMEGKKFESETYRYGFNGMEKDEDAASEHYTAEFWVYNSKIARRWNVDPVVKEHESPYAAFANNPIWFGDYDGQDTLRMNIKRAWDDSRAILYKVTFSLVRQGQEEAVDFGSNLHIAQSTGSFVDGNRLGYLTPESESKTFNLSFDKMSRHPNWENTIRVTDFGVFIHHGPVVDGIWSTGCFICMRDPSDIFGILLAPPSSGKHEIMSYEDKKERKEHSIETLAAIRSFYDLYKNESTTSTFGFQLVTNSEFLLPDEPEPSLIPLEVIEPSVIDPETPKAKFPKIIKNE